MNKLESFLLLIIIFGLITAAGGLIYNIFEGDLDDE